MKQPIPSLLMFRALKMIARLLDGKEWNADTCDSIASILRQAGFTIREPR